MSIFEILGKATKHDDELGMDAIDEILDGVSGIGDKIVKNPKTAHAKYLAEVLLEIVGDLRDWKKALTDDSDLKDERRKATKLMLAIVGTLTFLNAELNG